MSQSVVIDANRIFSELIAANHKLRRVFASQPETEFHCPKYVLVELFKHKERIAKATGATFLSTLANLEGEETFDASMLGTAEECVQERISDDELILIKK